MARRSSSGWANTRLEPQAEQELSARASEKQSRQKAGQVSNILFRPQPSRSANAARISVHIFDNARLAAEVESVFFHKWRQFIIKPGDVGKTAADHNHVW